jgi:aryl-alcohol dehydrogenase-like predicted oxidoreductase
MKENKIILGTVQLGLNYGINNLTGQPGMNEAFRIIDTGIENGIYFIDTADSYGTALEVLGNYIRKRKTVDLNIINKFKLDNRPLEEKLGLALKVLGIESIYCYMYHNFSDYESFSAEKKLEFLKKSRLIKKTGVSIYSIDQLKKVILDSSIDVIQLPVNLLDLSNEKEDLLLKAKSLGKEIHARSVFLQGLIFKKPEDLVGPLEPLRPYIQRLRQVTIKKNIDLKSLALNYVLSKQYIDYVVIGVERAAQLVDNINAAKINIYNDKLLEGVSVDTAHTFLLNPSNWNK